MDLKTSDLEGPEVDRRTTIKLFATAGVMGAAGLAGCADNGQQGNGAEGGGGTGTGTDAPASAKKGGSIEVGWLIDELVELDPHYVDLGHQIQVHSNVFNGLVKIDENNKLVGDLATDWTIPDDTTYVFQLQDGVTFHNGDKLDAAAVKASIERLQGLEDSPHRSKVEPIDSIEASGTELTINLSNAVSPFLTFMVRGPGRAGTIVNAKAAEEMGRDEYTLTPVGSGPFKVGDRATGESLTLEKFDDYWETDDEGNNYPYLDEVTLRLIPEGSTMWSAVQSESVMYTSQIGGNFAKQAEGARNLRSQASSSGDWTWLAFLCNDPAEHEEWAKHASGYDQVTDKWQNEELVTTDPKVRRAMAAAIDQQAIVEKAYFGFAVPAHSVYNPAIGWLYDHLGGEEPDPGQYHDPEEAKKLLDEAGYTGDTRMKVEILADTAEDKRQTTIIEQQFADVGIDLEINLQQPSSYWDQSYRYDQEIVFYGGAADIDPWMTHWRQLGNHRPDIGMGEWQRSLWDNDEFSDLIEDDLGTPDIEKRKELLKQAHETYVADAPGAAVVFPLNPKVSNTKLHDVGIQAGLSNFHYAWVEK